MSHNPLPVPPPPSPGLDVRTVVVLFRDDRLLLLKRADWKRIEPGRWTGLGGKVEAGEYDDLTASARREMFEETDLAPEEVSGLTLRRTLTFAHPTVGIVLLLYFTGYALTDRLPACNEGSLAWVTAADLPALDVIENTAQVIPLLIEDIRLDHAGASCGIAREDAARRPVEVIFAPPTVFRSVHT